MRVDLNLPLSNAPESGRSPETHKKGDVNSPRLLGPPVEAHVSATADRVSVLHAQLSQVPDIRQERISAVSTAIRQGTWNVSADEIANAMVSELLARAGAKG